MNLQYTTICMICASYHNVGKDSQTSDNFYNSDTTTVHMGFS